MLATNPASDQTGSVTGTLLELIRQGKVTTDRLLRENAYLRAEVAHLASENAELRAGLASRSGEAPS
jgi:cell division protein FtsB